MMKLFNSKKSILILFLAIAGSYWVLNYLFDAKEDQPPPRFCEEKNRVLTNEEVIVAALESKYKNNSIKSDESTKTASAFYKKYPFCCCVDSPAKPKNRRSFFTGKRYMENPGYVVAELYFPATNEWMSTIRTVCNGIYKKDQTDKSINYTSDGTCMLLQADKSLNYIKSRVPVSNCGGIGSATHKDLNIKHTPFGNDELKASNL